MTNPFNLKKKNMLKELVQELKSRVLSHIDLVESKSIVAE